MDSLSLYYLGIFLMYVGMGCFVTALMIGILSDYLNRGSKK